MRANTKGVYAERWRHARGCGRFFNALRDTTTDHFLAVYKTRRSRGLSLRMTSAAGTFAPRAAAASTATQPLHVRIRRPALRGLSRATRSPPPCSPTACTWSGARSSITGRAASSSAGSEEPNALVTVRRDAARTTPNLRATQVELYDGLIAESQNRWPSLQLRCRPHQRSCCRAFFPAGFYYKTFMWPRGAWKALYEPVIRRAAGLGRAPAHADPDRYAQRYAHCDVLVVGAGPAGIAAALAAAEGGARVMLCDEQPEFGGSLLTRHRAP